MVWPKFKWSTDPELMVNPRSGTLRGRIYVHTPNGGRDYVHFPSLSPHAKESLLQTLDGYSDLKPDVRSKIARTSDTILRRVEEAWRAIEDCIILSSPEQVGRQIHPFVWRLWRWTISTGIHSVDTVTSYWKMFCKHLYYLNAGEDHNDPPKLPDGFPGCTKTKLGKVWFDLFPWLEFSFSSSSKYLQEKFAHLCNSRGMPPPSLTSKRKSEEYGQFRERLTRKWPISEDLKSFCFATGRRLARMIKASELPSAAHVSLSGMASLDAPRNIGGRATEVASDFINDYVKNLATVTVEGLTWFGARFSTVKGRPMFETMCREAHLKSLKNYAFLESNFETPIKLPFESGYQIEEPIIGVDSQLGYQLLQHAIETGIDKGFIDSPKRKLPGYSLKLSGKPIPVRAEAIGEPGNKVRWITVSPGWTNLVLQPLGHELGNLIANDPVLRSGFTRSWKGWDFACDLAKGRTLSKLEPWLVVKGDLEAATDNMTHEYTRAALKGYLVGSNRDTEYLRFCVELLTSPREVIYGGEADFRSTCGILMGDPGTKAGLALNFRIARHLALMRFHFETAPLSELNRLPVPHYEWDVGRCAGDDFVEVGPLKYLQKIKQANEALGHRVGTFVISNRVVSYCEETLLFQDKALRHELPLWKVDYNSHIHVDALKVRVFSPCGKVSPGSAEDFKNPVIGKGQALERKLAWLPQDWKHLETAFVLRWAFRMKAYMDLKEPYWFLPIQYGGTGCPCPFEKRWIVLATLKRCPEFFKASGAVLDGRAPFWLTKALQAMSRGGISRGSELDLRQAAHEGYLLASEIAGKTANEQDIAKLQGLSHEEFASLPRGKRRKIAKDHGFITEFDLDTRIEKAWLIKSAFQKAFFGFEDEEGLARRRDPDILWSQLSELINSTESRVLPHICLTEEVNKLHVSLVRSLRPKEIKHSFFKEELLSRSFGALKTPLPATTHDMMIVRGSSQDILS